MKCLCIVLILAAFVDIGMSDGLCSQIYQSYQACVDQKGTDQTVDYGVINSTMEDMIAKLKQEYDEKFQKLEAEVTEIKKGFASDCLGISTRTSSDVSEGLFTIYPNLHSAEVFCDLTTDKGGWTVFQRRMDGSVDFFRDWDEYVYGFGDKTGEFWLGLELLHKLTSKSPVELRIELEDWEGNKRYAKYSSFHVGDASSSYLLTVGGYVGDAGDSFSEADGMKFSTKDKDFDTWSKHCAVEFKGAWWYSNCHSSNLNGFYFKEGAHASYADGVEWEDWKGYYYSMKFAEMKLRPKK